MEPREWQDIRPQVLPWQQPVLEQILLSQQQERLAHGLYLHADEGVDVAAFTLALGQALTCQQPDPEGACGHCPTCQSWSHTQYANLHWLGLEYDEKKKKYRKDISVEQIRSLIHHLQLTSHQASLKLAIIYPAEKLNRSAANSFLKTLEEAPENTVILLAGHQRGALPITLLSRCQVWSLPKPTAQQAHHWLNQQALEFELSEKDLNRSGGHPQRLLAWHHDGYLNMQEHLTQQAREYLRQKISAVEFAEMLQELPVSRCREFLLHLLEELIRHQLGLSEKSNPNKIKRSRAAHLFELREKAQRWLHTEDNNLNIQFQIEDVLLSMQSILTDRSI